MTTVANGLAERGVGVTLALGVARGPYLPLVDSRVRVLDLGGPAVTRVLWSLIRHLRQERPDGLIAAMSHANVLAALAHRVSGSAARLVLSERAHPSSVFEEFPGLRMTVTRALMQSTYPWADEVVAVSEGVRQDLARHVVLRPTQSRVVYNPVVDDELMRRLEQPPGHPWLATSEPPVVVGAGRLIAQKDFATLIDAFAIVRRQRTARLLVIGDGELRSALRQQADAAGVAADVDLPGFTDNPFAVMKAARVFVLSSRFEGLPGVLIQAMASGARVVSTDCPSGPREILEHGRWGSLVPVGDATAMAMAILAALDDDGAPDARERAAQFSVDAAVSGYLRALRMA